MKIKARNFKLNSFEYDIEPVTIVTGDVGKGKSAILEAIQLAHLGFIPHVGKKASTLMELSPSKRLEVSLHGNIPESEKAFEITRRIEGTTKRAKSELSSNLGTDDEIKQNLGQNPVVFDINEFMNLSENKARDFLFSILPTQFNSEDKESVFSYFNPEDLKEIEKQTMPQMIIAKSIEIANDHLKKARSDKKEYAATQKQLADRNLELADIPGQLKEKREELDRKTSELLELSKKQDGSRELREIIEKELINAEKQLMSLDDDQPNIEKELKSLKDKCADLKENIDRRKSKILDLDKEKYLIDIINVFDGSINAGDTCPTCKRKFTTDDIETLKKNKMKFAMLIADIEEKIERLKGEITVIEKNQTNLERECKETERKKDANEHQRETLKNLIEANKTKINAMPPVETESDLENIEKQKKMLTDDTKHLQTEIETLIRKKETAGNVEEAAENLKTARHAENEWKQAIKVLRELMAKLLSSSIAPFKEIFNEILSEIWPQAKFELSFFDENLKPEFIANVSGRSFLALSDGQKAIFGLAWMTAIQKMYNAPLRYILIDRGEALNNLIEKFLAGAKKCVDAGYLHYVVIAAGFSDYHSPTIDGVKHIDLNS